MGDGGWRPFTQVVLWPPDGSGGTPAQELALIDSGCPDTAVPFRYVEVLSIDPARLYWGMEYGLGSAAEAAHYADGLDIEIGGARVRAPLVVFSRICDHAMIGQTFFAQFEAVTFRERQRKVVLSGGAAGPEG